MKPLAGHLSPVFLAVPCIILACSRLAAQPNWPHPRPATNGKTPLNLMHKVVALSLKSSNMDHNHRDRIAFVRLCAGKFQRG